MHDAHDDDGDDDGDDAAHGRHYTSSSVLAPSCGHHHGHMSGATIGMITSS